MTVTLGGSLTFDGSGVDGGLFTFITGFARDTRWLNGPLAFWTDTGLAAFAVLMLAGIWYSRHRGARALAVAVAAPVATMAALGIAELIKPLVSELRPCYSLPGDFYVDACPSRTDFAFPSAHSAFAFGAVAALWLVDRRLSTIAAAFACLEGFTRVYLGDHYPHDVLGAIIIAMPVAFLVSYGVSRLAGARFEDGQWAGPASPWGARFRRQYPGRDSNSHPPRP